LGVGNEFDEILEEDVALEYVIGLSTKLTEEKEDIVDYID
jgi:hypothetical protein